MTKRATPTTPFRRVWAIIIENSLLLLAGTVAGLVWANLAPASYRGFSQALRFAVNDVGMVFFFALAVKEIVESMLPGGALESPREAAVPFLAALGGIAGPAGLFILQTVVLERPDLTRGWAMCRTL